MSQWGQVEAVARSQCDARWTEEQEACLQALLSTFAFGTSGVLGDLASRLSFLSIFRLGEKEELYPNPEKDSFPLKNPLLHQRGHKLGLIHGHQGDTPVMLTFPVLLGPT